MSIRLTPEMTLTVRALSEVQIEPAGDRVAYVSADRSTPQGPVSRIHLAAIDGTAESVVMTCEGRTPLVRWSPQGTCIAVLVAAEDGNGDRLDLLGDSGDHRRTLRVPAGEVTDVQWSADERRLYVLATDRARPEPSNATLDGDAPEHTSLWILHVDLDEPVRFDTHGRQLWEFALAPRTGRIIAVTSTGITEGDWFDSVLELFESTGSSQVVLDGLVRDPDEPRAHASYRQIAKPAWSPDETRVAMVVGARSDRDIVGGDLCLYDVSQKKFSNLTAGRRITVTCAAWEDEHSLVFVGYAEGRQCIGHAVVSTGAVEILWVDDASFGRFHPRFTRSRAGTIALTRDTPASPPEVWSVRMEGERPTWTQHSKLNAAAERWERPRLEQVDWRSRDGMALSGLVLLPPAASPGRGNEGLPLVTWVHGGPSFLHKATFFGAAIPWIISSIPALLAARGLAVFLPNPRGSLGWGSEFAERVIGDMGGADGRDILEGVEACVTGMGFDPRRLGIGGWSYGGFMSAWLTTQTSRFAAAFVGAGVVNWRSLHGTSSAPLVDRQLLRDDPYAVGGEYDRRSPITLAGRVDTPTMVAHGLRDAFVPPGQALEWITALRENGCTVEGRFFEEGHDFAGVDAQCRLATELGDWFASHLGRDC